MKELKKILEKPTYREDPDFEINMVEEFDSTKINESIIKDNVIGLYLDKFDPVDEQIPWNYTLKIKQGKKLSDAIDRLPYGVLDKTITGLGATTLELMTDVRNSIIVVPTKSLAYNKCKSVNTSKGELYALYIGSPIKEYPKVAIEKVKEYVDSRKGKKQKFMVVADSLPILIKYLEQLDIEVYKDYFLMVDEIDTMQADSSYRPRLEAVMDYFFNFPKHSRVAVSATLNSFSDPRMNQEPIVTTIWENVPKRDIELIYTNYVDDVAIRVIKELKNTTNDNILIAYNSLDGIFNIIQQLNVDKSTCGILCSERSEDKIKDYLEDTENVIDEKGNLTKRIVFMTSAYFAGIDIITQCHLITISSHKQPFTYLSINRITQIAGRCRKGNLSETIIYDTKPTELATKYSNREEYMTSLLERANSYAKFLNSTREAVDKDKALKPILDFIDSFMTYISKSNSNSDSPLKIVRQVDTDKQFVPAYFNIDALCEVWDLRYSLYTHEEVLKKQLEASNNINFKKKIIDKEQHTSSSLANIKEKNKERMANRVELLINSLTEWHNNGKDERKYHELESTIQDDKLKEISRLFKKFSPYIPHETLSKGLRENCTDGRKLRNYINALVFHILPQNHSFKLLVFDRFNYGIKADTTKRGTGVYTSDERKEILKSIFNELFPSYYKIGEDTLQEFFKCFFKTTRSGAKEKIIGLNPKEFPNVITHLPIDADLKELFIFPNK